MKSKYLISLAAAAIGSTALAFTAVHAQGWGHHGGHHHHGSLLAKVCIVTMPSSERPALKALFTSSGLKAAFETVKKDKAALAEAVLTGGNQSAVSSAESTLNTDEGTLRAAQTNLEVAICQKLSPGQLAKANTLYNQLVANRETVRGYFEAARP